MNKSLAHKLRFWHAPLAAALLFSTASVAQTHQPLAGYPIAPVPFTQVQIAPHTFWGERMEASRTVTIPLAFSKCESEGRYENFVKASHPSDAYDVPSFMGYSFDDTDVYKTIEGASYVLSLPVDAKDREAKRKHDALKHYIDSVLDIVAAAQEPDGYLYTARTINPKKPHQWAGDTRWSKEEDLSHELYNLGHMVEAAVAHWQATGSRKFLDIACRYADCVVREVGPNPAQACVVPGHQIAEMALARLYIATGEKKYLDEAKFFLDWRGKTTIKHEYSQAHKPVVEQDEAVGHAVRAAYMYAGMADVAALTGDSSYIRAIDRIWENIVSKKLYITGGIGSTSNGEAFGKNYELPNMSAYCETCAAIGNVYVNYRLFLLHGESKYFDVLERTLYNGLISGVSLDGGTFFYPNPLESMGQHQRQPWFGCACCPSNICRFMPSLPGYVYAVNNRVENPAVFVNLYMSNSTELAVNGKKVAVTQTTNYPWDGNIRVRVDKNFAGRFTLKLRIPGWARGHVVPSDLYTYHTQPVKTGDRWDVCVNGISQEVLIGEDGYLSITRKWKKGDTVELSLPMLPKLVRANSRVEADRGMVSIERGPIVYCAEWPDNDFNLHSLLLNQSPRFEVVPTDFSFESNDSQHATIHHALNMITTEAQVLNFDQNGRLETQDVTLRLIPYYAWCHRGSGNMRVWLPQNLNATRPALPATIASESKIDASVKTKALSSINDRLTPKDGDDRSVPYYHWWPKQASTEWISYEFKEEAVVSEATVYWFDDQPWGGCSVPTDWKILYLNKDGIWQPVNAHTKYGTKKGEPNTVVFDPVKVRALKLEVQLPSDKSAGIFEWEVK